MSDFRRRDATAVLVLAMVDRFDDDGCTITDIQNEMTQLGIGYDSVDSLRVMVQRAHRRNLLSVINENGSAWYTLDRLGQQILATWRAAIG